MLEYGPLLLTYSAVTLIPKNFFELEISKTER